MSNDDRYRVTRKMPWGRGEIFLPTHLMNTGDLVVITPCIGTIQLTQNPNGFLVGRTLVGNAPQRIPVTDIQPDEQGRVEYRECRGATSYAEGCNIRPRGER